MATESTEAIRLAKEIKRIKEERKEDAKNATIIKFDADDKAAVQEDEEYIDTLEDELEEAKTGDENENSIIDGILGVKKVKGGYTAQNYHYYASHIIYNLPVETAIQKALIYGNYIYVIQRKGKDVCFSRYNKSNGQPTEIETNEKSEFYGKSKCMVLEDFGHPQSLECNYYKNKYYFWICCGVKNFGSQNKPVYWSTEIARIEYQAGKTIKSSQQNRLINLKTVGKPIKRTDMALNSSTDKPPELAIWTRDTDGHDRYAFYNLNKVNKALDEKTARSCDSTDLKKACVSYVNVKNTPGLVEQSFQGMELTNNRNAYIASGTRADTKKIVKINDKAVKKRYQNIK